MVDRLRTAAEHLDAPRCPSCNVEMSWFRSELVRDMPESLIVHQFVCPNCRRAHRTETEFKPAQVLPDKLGAPRFFSVAA